MNPSLHCTCKQSNFFQHALTPDKMWVVADLTARKFQKVALEAARNVERLVGHHSLDMLLAAGYRVTVRSSRGYYN